ncbi:MAG: hypothetical protein HGA90_02500 [Alphaproteobacteria bacterium]|nr:hypothetical protein [Alphaproteobacteria bacterium]
MTESFLETPPSDQPAEGLPTAGLDEATATKYRSLVKNTDQFLGQIKTTPIKGFQFQIDGLLYQVGYRPKKDESIHLSIWAVLGYLPFSVVSVERRRLLIDILEGAKGLQHAKLGIDNQHQIYVMGELSVKELQLPNFFFVPLIHFMQEARPFIRLIGEHL